jgi:lambda family phage portal protein
MAGVLTGMQAAWARWQRPAPTRSSEARVAALAGALASAGKPIRQVAAQRTYGGATVGRLTNDWNPLNTSADSELVGSIRALRSRSRQLTRDNEYALRAKRLVQTNVIGQGIGMQAQVANVRGRLVDSVNTQIENEFERWCNKRSCHTGGTLHFHDIERLLLGELFEAGEVLVRYIKQPFGDSRVPLALEVIEADRLIDTWQTAKAPNGNAIRMGVEVDQWQRPVAYWLYPSHPGDYQFTSFQPSRFIRVPVEEIDHLFVQDRLPQTRGVPWMHAALKRLKDVGGYAEAEIVAARASASIMGFIKTPELEPSDNPDADTQPVYDLEPGVVKQLLPGQEFTGFNPSRPNAAMDPFMRLMLRGIASAIGVSYESLSRDYSQSNYSSSRLSLLDDRDLYKVLQRWTVRNFREPLHKMWMEQAVLAGALSFPDFYSQRDKYEAVRFRPRGWSWVDPIKEVAAYESAVQAGFMTVGDVVGATGNGQDLEDVLKARRAELDQMAELDLHFSTSVAPVKVGVSPLSVLNSSQQPGAVQDTGNADGPTNEGSTATGANPEQAAA